MNTTRSRHFNQTPRRKAEILTPPNRIKQKVGHGGLTSDVLDKAQKLLESVTDEFPPMAQVHLDAINTAINRIRQEKREKSPSEINEEELITSLIYPTMQIKAHGGMFKYQLATDIADNMIQFLEVIETLDNDAMEIIEAHNTTLRAIVSSQISGDGGHHGKNLINELHKACSRYFSKYDLPGK